MTNTNDVRKAHELLDDISNGNQPNMDGLNHLRSFLPELPKQKALAEIIAHVDDAWSVASGNDWGGNSYDTEISIEDWLTELHEQLKGLIDTPVAVPALPAGMRLADHEDFGRVITSPKPNRDGVYDLLVTRPKFETGADWEYAHERELTFIDAEPTHPEFLETEADYANAPEGTIVVLDGGTLPFVKDLGWPMDMSHIRRRLLRWGWGE